jgi:hypothetical protein
MGKDKRQVIAMLTVLLAVLLLITVVWALHDSRVVVERHKLEIARND